MAIQVITGMVAVGLFLAWFEMTERERERRHAERPDDVTEVMLRLAQLTNRDSVFDLECGDGGVVVAAAQRYGARGWCFDIYPRRLTDARERARHAGVENLISFREQHWDSVDVSPATVVIIGLTNPTGHSGNYKVCGQLTRHLRPGSRILSPWIGLGDWEPAAVVPVADSSRERNRKVRLWIADGVGETLPRTLAFHKRQCTKAGLEALLTRCVCSAVRLAS